MCLPSLLSELTVSKIYWCLKGQKIEIQSPAVEISLTFGPLLTLQSKKLPERSVPSWFSSLSWAAWEEFSGQYISVTKFKSSSSIESWINVVKSDSFGAAHTSSIAAVTNLPARPGKAIVPSSLLRVINFLGDVLEPRLDFPLPRIIWTRSPTWKWSLGYTLKQTISVIFRFVINISWAFCSSSSTCIGCWPAHNCSRNPLAN